MPIKGMRKERMKKEKKERRNRHEGIWRMERGSKEKYNKIELKILRITMNEMRISLKPVMLRSV